ncbi:hypothetical protein BCR39DRAFT_554477 [Naematelia encephala]|uniref:Uncharacterized protein n=1 Tax=Naematelia encephala TaxID=71784 RepID=A0A1Y2AEA1_9TREE|nr:hypothetical protein BCR39DRAFT_554477 [Naematelia encephala]
MIETTSTRYSPQERFRIVGADYSDGHLIDDRHFIRSLQDVERVARGLVFSASASRPSNEAVYHRLRSFERNKVYEIVLDHDTRAYGFVTPAEPDIVHLRYDVSDVGLSNPISNGNITDGRIIDTWHIRTSLISIVAVLAVSQAAPGQTRFQRTLSSRSGICGGSPSSRAHSCGEDDGCGDHQANFTVGSCGELTRLSCTLRRRGVGFREISIRRPDERELAGPDGFTAFSAGFNCMFLDELLSSANLLFSQQGTVKSLAIETSMGHILLPKRVIKNLYKQKNENWQESLPLRPTSESDYSHGASLRYIDLAPNEVDDFGMETPPVVPCQQGEPSLRYSDLLPNQVEEMGAGEIEVPLVYHQPYEPRGGPCVH